MKADENKNLCSKDPQYEKNFCMCVYYRENHVSVNGK